MPRSLPSFLCRGRRASHRDRSRTRCCGSCFCPSSAPQELLFITWAGPWLRERLGSLGLGGQLQRRGERRQTAVRGAARALRPAASDLAPSGPAAGAPVPAWLGSGAGAAGGSRARLTAALVRPPAVPPCSATLPAAAVRTRCGEGQPCLECPALCGRHREAVGSPPTVTGQSSKRRNLRECWILSQD